MAKNTSSNDSDKDSPPSPPSPSSSSTSSDDSESPKSSPSNSPPPPSSPPPSEKSSPPATESPQAPAFSPPPSPSPPPRKKSPPPPSSKEPPPQSPPLSSPPPPEDNSPPSPNSQTPRFSPPQPPAGSGPKYPSPPRVSQPKQSGASLKIDSPSTPPSSSGNNTVEIVGLTLAGVFVVALLALLLCFISTMRKQKRASVFSMQPHMKSDMNGGDVHYFVEEPGFGSGANGAMDLRSPSDPAHQHINTGMLVLTNEMMAEITNGFDNENIIGEGGFGYVYKASFPDGRVGALKMLKAGSSQGEREFSAEVDIISRIHHRHLVSLIGYCISEQQRGLIYEFVPNGNLNQHLHGNGWPILDWPKRMKIAIGAARGLAYLHDGCNPKIIHRDIKSANILLDNAYEAQVADFGLARLTDHAHTHVSTRVMGTFGYMAPEYATSGKLTDRSDVFSFGVVLLELITGRKPVDTMQPIGEESLVEWARPLLHHAVETGDFGKLVDPRLEQQYVHSEMFKMVEAAAASVRHSAIKRPRMVQIARALDTGDHLYDLSNGVKYGQSTVYDSGQYDKDISRFKRMVNGSYDDSEFDMKSTDYGSNVSGEMSATGSESEFRVLHDQRSNAEKMP